jgi:hypothetical protein
MNSGMATVHEMFKLLSVLQRLAEKADLPSDPDIHSSQLMPIGERITEPEWAPRTSVTRFPLCRISRMGQLILS